MDYILDSKLHVIDPWEDYKEYPEYRGKQDIFIYTFKKNIENSGVKNK